jgi:hypothetical protein
MEFAYSQCLNEKPLRRDDKLTIGLTMALVVLLHLARLCFRVGRSTWVTGFDFCWRMAVYLRCPAGAGSQRRATPRDRCRCGESVTARCILRPTGISARDSVRRLVALEPELEITGHGRPMRGAAMRQALHRLAKDFDDVAVPKGSIYAPHEPPG